MSRTTKHEFEPEQVMAYLDGELDATRAAALAGHLEHCDECRATATQFRQLSERLLDYSVEPPAESPNAAVLASLGSFEPAKKCDSREVHEVVWDKLKRLFKGPASWAVATAVVVGVALVIAGVREVNAPRDSRWMNADVAYLKVAHSAAPTDSAAPVLRGKAPQFSVRNRQQDAGADENEKGGGGDGGAIEAPMLAAPMIAQTASLTIVATNYDEASAAIDRLARAHGGYVQKLTAEARTGASRELSVTLRVPAAQLDGFLAEMRKLGHVEKETRANDEVTDQYVDLQARLKSARATEQRLLELLASRTGKLEDVLAAEQELARIREEIESMEGQRVVLLHRVDYATVDVGLQEEYREQLHTTSPSAMGSIRNALVEGIGNLEDVCVSTLVFLFAYGPSILFWLVILLVPAWLIGRRLRSTRAS